MGKSTASSCLKIIACGSDSVDRDALEAPSEVKNLKPLFLGSIFHLFFFSILKMTSVLKIESFLWDSVFKWILDQPLKLWSLILFWVFLVFTNWLSFWVELIFSWVMELFLWKLGRKVLNFATGSLLGGARLCNVDWLGLDLICGLVGNLLDVFK